MEPAEIRQPTGAGTAAATAGRAARPHRLALAVVLAGAFMATLDFFIVNVAIPSMQRDLHATDTAIESVIAGYGLAYAAGLILGSRLGDRYGRRAMFALGLALFTVTSVICGVAPDMTVLVIARVGQGLASALFFPQVLAILGSSYQGAARAKAFTAYGLTLGLAAVGGQLLGGVLIDLDPAGTGWRSCFLINLPVGALALAWTRRAVPESREPVRTPIDVVGTILVTAGMVALVLPLIVGRQHGWPVWTWCCLAVSLPLFAGFLARQRAVVHRGGSPLIDLRLFAERTFAAGIVSSMVFFAGMASYFLVLTIYLQQGLGLGPLESGLVFSVIGAGFFATSLYSTRLRQLLGPQSMAIGAAVMAVGLAGIGVTVAAIGSTGNVWWLAPALLADGLGMGLVMAPLTAVVLAGLPAHQAGMASGALSTVQQIGNALGVAVVGIVFYGAIGRATATGATANPVPHALQVSLPLLIGVALLFVVVVQPLARPATKVR